jgi:hypothetical protein
LLKEEEILLKTGFMPLLNTLISGYSSPEKELVKLRGLHSSSYSGIAIKESFREGLSPSPWKES